MAMLHVSGDGADNESIGSVVGAASCSVGSAFVVVVVRLVSCTAQPLGVGPPQPCGRFSRDGDVGACSEHVSTAVPYFVPMLLVVPAAVVVGSSPFLQSLVAKAEAQELMMVPRNIVSPQSNKPVMGIVQVWMGGVVFTCASCSCACCVSVCRVTHVRLLGDACRDRSGSICSICARIRVQDSALGRALVRGIAWVLLFTPTRYPLFDVVVPRLVCVGYIACAG